MNERDIHTESAPSVITGPAGGGADDPPLGDHNLGFTARIVELFIDSKLSLLLILGSIFVGAWALYATPREEDPQVVVPIIDVRVAMPGATAEEIERLAATPLESILSEIPEVEHVYTMSRPGGCVATARFFVGTDREEALTKVFTRLEANRDRVPPGVPGWQVVPVDVDDIPILTVALFSRDLDYAALRDVANEVREEVGRVPHVGKTYTVGGRRREITINLDPARLASRNLTVPEIAGALRSANVALPSGSIVSGNSELSVRTGPFIETVEDVASLVVGVSPGSDGTRRPIYLADVAEIVEGPSEPEDLTRIGFGPAMELEGGPPEGYSADLEYPQVTIAVAKHRGSNAVWVAEGVMERLGEIDGTVIPDGVEYRITRDYGETANEKVNELVEHLAVAIITIILLLGFTLGWKEAFVVGIAVPMTLAVTLFADLITGYTINRVTLFALVVSLGLLVDDPIVDVENIYRHFKLRRHPPKLATLIAVDEIRPPTILATFTVIVAFLPTGFITGMMGAYMGPMAFNIPIVMLMSLLVAFTVTPWAAYHLLRGEYDKPEPPFEIRESRIYGWYSRIMRPLIRSRGKSLVFLGIMGLLWLASLALVPLGLVPVKQLPFDNKSELLLVVRMPEGTPLEETDALLAEFGDYLRSVPEVADYETFTGVSAPIDFNGLARHYDLRRGGNIGDVRINLAPKENREWASHSLALRIRPEIERIATARGALVKIVETPPGPPVLATLVGVVEGPPDSEYGDIVEVASDLRGLLDDEPLISEVDWMLETERDRMDVTIDREKAALHGVPVEAAAQTVSLALGGGEAGGLRGEGGREPVLIRMRLPRSERTDLAELMELRVRGRGGDLVPLGEVADIERVPEERTIFHRDGRRAVYLLAEPTGISPMEAVLGLADEVSERVPEGFEVSWTAEGELNVSKDVFRDLGIGFGAALVMIYILLVGQTGSLMIPLVIMIAIPLTMIGVFPGFMGLNLLFAPPVGALPDPIFFTAPGMIGLIGLAGIVVRNSILLIDFIAVLRKRGHSLEEAIIEAGATRFRPILLTAATAVIGGLFIVSDPVFNGLGWSFTFGIVVSTAFTLVVVPAVYALIFHEPLQRKEVIR